MHMHELYYYFSYVQLYCLFKKGLCLGGQKQFVWGMGGGGQFTMGNRGSAFSHPAYMLKKALTLITVVGTLAALNHQRLYVNYCKYF